MNIAAAAAAVPSIVSALVDAGVEVAAVGMAIHNSTVSVQPTDPESWLTAVRAFRLQPQPLGNRYDTNVDAAGFVAGHMVTVYIGSQRLADHLQIAPQPDLIVRVRDAVAAAGARA